jgi:hypothetical protein
MCQFSRDDVPGHERSRGLLILAQLLNLKGEPDDEDQRRIEQAGYDDR